MSIVLSGPGETFLSLFDGTLRAGSSTFERVWRVLPDGTLQPESFIDRIANLEWASPEATGPGEAFAGPISLEAAERDSPVAADSLLAVLRLPGVTYHLQIFSAVRGVRITRQTEKALSVPGSMAEPDSAAPTGIESDAVVAAAATAPAAGAGRIDGFALSPLHLRLVQVSFQDQTDRYNELVWEREWLLHTAEQAMALSGCLFAAEDVLTGTGLVFLKEAPLPHARPNPTNADLEVAPAARRLFLQGEEYPIIVFAYEGGAFGRTAALQAYQRALRPYVPGRDGLQLSNTWGDRNRDGRIHADFMAQEIEAGARLGVDVVQIDDGWQWGATSNSVRAQAEGGVWEGFYAARDNFWSVHDERFPSGLAPLVAAARAKGMRFGLWFGPDSSNDFAAWERDADTLIALHREMGIDCFKIDGVKVRSRQGERNLHSFFRRVLDQTAGKVVFDLDITAETRPGYFGLMDAGPLFLENRYTDWHRYWPHQTLRNLWKLGRYVDPLRLRMEWLNHARHEDKYAGDPLAPNAYRPDYLFATVMFSSPLGWFEVSTLPESYFAEAAPLIAVWKEHRERIFGGTIFPVGEAPDGVAWTGFVSAGPEGVYILAFREQNSSGEWSITLPFLPEVEGAVEATRLGGEGEARLLPNRTLAVSIPERQRFLFARIDTADQNQPMSMTRESLADLPARPNLPPGIEIRPMAGFAEAALWTDVQRDAEPFFAIADDLFTREFGTDDASISSRCLLAVDTTTGEAVAASSAWHGGDTGARGSDWGRLHWVAVRPDYQRRGIARALVIECLHKMAEMGHPRAYLNTSTGRHGAIALYASLGFVRDNP